MARPEDFRALVELCDERGIRLLSDEVYRCVELDPSRALPQAADLSETAVSLNPEPALAAFGEFLRRR